MLEKVIVALDFEYPEQAYRIVEELGDAVKWYKIGPALFARSGAEIIQFLHRRNKKIFLDLKLHDTPNVVGMMIRQLADLGVQLATVHCLGGRAMLESAAYHCRGSQVKLIGVTLLTSQSEKDYQDIGLKESSRELIPQLVDLALESRLAGVICSPHELREIRSQTIPNFLLVAPGIRIPGQEVFQDDQKRFASPDEALAWGADYLIVGRPITQAREPREAALRLFQSSTPVPTNDARL